LLASQKIVDNDDKFTDVDTDPLLVKDDLLIGASSRGVVALDSKDLQKKWIHTVDGISFMELNSGILYYTTYNAKVEALQLDTREVIWRYNGGRGSLGKPVIAGRWLIASSSEHSLLVLDRSSGTLVQVFDPGKGGVSTPTLRDDRVYWVSNGQVLYCMTLLQ
jgi:outer membrane protein assembly factor BamB